MKLLVINGPNLNLLGTREPEIYGRTGLDDIQARLTDLAAGYGLELEFFQSNHEGELVEAIQRAGWECDGLILNAGAYTHTSVAIHDAVAAITPPTVEVHLSNPLAREEFRWRSLLAEVCAGSISGFGVRSYELALWWFVDRGQDEIGNVVQIKNI